MTSSEQQSQPADGSLLRQIREKALVSFAQQTTAHGLVRLTQGSGLRRLIWGMAVVGACIGFSVHLVELAQRYLSYPVSTEFSRDGSEFQFPSVTICPTNPFVHMCEPAVSNYTIPGDPRCLVDVMYDIPRLYYLLQQKDWNVSMSEAPYEYFYDGRLAVRILAYRGNVSARPHEIVMYCRYNSELCSFQNFTVYKDEERFTCYSFHPSNRTISRSGEGSGLYLVLHLRADAYLTDEEQVDYVDGFRVALHEDGFRPDMSSGFLVPYGYKTSAKMTAETVTKVNRESAQCSDDLPNVTYTMDFSWPGNFENQSFFGTNQDCVIRLMQEEYKSSCGCLGTHLPLPSDLFSSTNVCHTLPEELLFRNIWFRQNQYGLVEYTMLRNSSLDIYTPVVDYVLEKWDSFNGTKERLQCYLGVIKRQKTQGVSAAQCPLRCSNTRYNTITTMNSWPKDATQARTILQNYAKEVLVRINGTGLNKNRVEFLRDHTNASLKLPSMHPSKHFISVLDLYSASLKTSLFTESFAYPLRNLFSDLGGILGLWVGVSIITLLEMIELVVELVKLIGLRLHTAVEPSNEVQNAESDSQQKMTPGGIYSPHTFSYSNRAISSSSTELQPHSEDQLQGYNGGKEFIKHRPSWIQRVSM